MIAEMYAQLQSLLLHIAEMYVFAFVAVAIVLVLAVILGTEFLKFSGSHLLMCPQTHGPALVKIDALHAAIGRIIGERDLRLLGCSRMEASRSCGRECLKNWR